MEFAYHRLAVSAPKYAWWKALVTGLIAVAVFVILSIIVSVGWLALSIAQDPSILDDPAGLTTSLLDPDLTDPLTFALVTVSIAVAIPAILIARRIMGPRPLGLLSSVAGRLRWGWLLRCAGLAALVIVVVFGLQFLLPSSGGAPTESLDASTLVLLVVLVLLLTPLQATAEEYIFRGYLMQTIGGWLKHPAWAILLPVPLFAIGHTQYGFLGLVDVAVFGLGAAYITWRTGGLEAAIALHVLNNGVLFLLGAFALVDNGASEGSVLGIFSTVVLTGAYILLVLWQAKRTGLKTTRTVQPEEPPMERWAPPAVAEYAAWAPPAPPADR